MNLQQLITFATVARHGNMSNAAESLGITQPAASKRIAALESDLESALFYRIGAGLTLTVAGKKLQLRAKEILSLVAETKNEILQLDSRVAGELQLACSHHIGLYRLPKVLSHFNAAFPEVELQINFTESEDAYQQVQQGQVDLALLTLPRTADAQIEQQSVWIEDMEIMIASGHPLFSVAKNNQFKKLIETPAIFPEHADFTRLIIEENFSQHSLIRAKGLGANNMEIIKMLIEAGLGWGVLPVAMKTTKLTLLPQTSMNFQRTLGFAYHQKRKPNSATREFIKILYP